VSESDEREANIARVDKPCPACRGTGVEDDRPVLPDEEWAEGISDFCASVGETIERLSGEGRILPTARFALTQFRERLERLGY
jgi:hypothetical protein